MAFPVSIENGRPAADQAFTSTALANITGWSHFLTTAGIAYRFECRVLFRSVALTTGLRLGLVVPANTGFSAEVQIPFAADGSGGCWFGHLTSSGDSVVSTGVPAINTDFLAKIDGIIVPSADGAVLQLQAATEVNNSAVTIKAASQSWVWAW